MLGFWSPWRRRARHGPWGALGRLLFALGFTVLAAQLMVYVALLFASEPVARHQVFEVHGSVPVKVRSATVATQCTLGDGRSLVVPKIVDDRTGRAFDRGIALPVDATATTIRCEADVIVVQSTLLPLASVARARWPVYLGAVVLAVGLTIAWPRQVSLRRQASPG